MKTGILNHWKSFTPRKLAVSSGKVWCIYTSDAASKKVLPDTAQKPASFQLWVTLYTLTVCFWCFWIIMQLKYNSSSWSALKTLYVNFFRDVHPHSIITTATINTVHHLSVPFSYLIINVDFKIRRCGLGVVVFTPHKGEDGGEEAGHHFEGGQVSASSLGGAARWGQVRVSQDGKGWEWCDMEDIN